MREATGQVGLMNIMLYIIGIIIVLLAGSIAYSKAFRVKNRIIDIIEQNNVYSAEAKAEVNLALQDIGYRKNNQTNLCPTKQGYTQEALYSDYLYCVYKTNNGDGSYYYKVIAYMYFDLPVVGTFLRIPVSGETKMLYKNNDWKTVD